MLSKEYLLKDYNSFKSQAMKAFEKSEFEKSLTLSRFCGYLAWSYPILCNYVDEELEELLDKIANKVIKHPTLKNSGRQNEERVVLYAGQLVDSGALTEQYLQFFIEQNYKILLIVPDVSNTKLAEQTLQLVKRTNGIEIFIPKSKKGVVKIQQIYDKVMAFLPSHVFLHFLPNDVIGYCVFTEFKLVKRFYIVHNDHTFWLGKGCSDYFLEFRKFGYLLAIQRRKISNDRLFLLPFYPINNQVEFKGFPFEKEDKIVGISGANLYKYFGDPELSYFHTIKKLLQNNRNFIFCLCGWRGDVNKIKKIFDEESIHGRFHFLGRRKDFYTLVGNSDILFESYPLKGGLTMMFAIEQNIPVIGIGNNRNASGCIEDWFDLTNYKEPLCFDEFFDEADSLIKNSIFRKKNVLKFAGNKFNKQDFERELTAILEGNDRREPTWVNETLPLDDEYFLNEYLWEPNSEISYLKSKLFILRNYQSLKDRIKTGRKLYQIKKYNSSLKEDIRMFVLIVVGK